MIKHTFFGFEQFVAFCQYLKKGTALIYIESSVNFVTVELSSIAFNNAKEEYEADTCN